MITIIAALLAAALFVALCCRDLITRGREGRIARLYNVSLWAAALALFVLIWANPQYGQSEAPALYSQGK